MFDQGRIVYTIGDMSLASYIASDKSPDKWHWKREREREREGGSNPFPWDPRDPVIATIHHTSCRPNDRKCSDEIKKNKFGFRKGLFEADQMTESVPKRTGAFIGNKSARLRHGQ